MSYTVIYLPRFAERLRLISLPGIEVRAAINEVFYGRGYQATFAGKRCLNTLVLPTELKKAFMDELSGEPKTAVLEVLHAEFIRPTATGRMNSTLQSFPLLSHSIACLAGSLVQSLAECCP